ncbi:uncharacterized protein L3040_002972 [Drepanopeziza brunnea f. sp. 'multigermtubi']|uniref:uncharacterized protein n=1 Tax=Drepanopeziza brunnea f. sp. 'multigermtubi' TaxID=698441 RepID=UPI0023964E23|nr:hypothetical protein L3040_002972 [Drepanopeziza brunnea f. sp. 'multigermtubi']
MGSVPSYEATVDGRARLSRIWTPTGGIAPKEDEDSHAKLIRAGFIRQAHPGIFHMLPLGRRVQDKLEALVDKYMFKLGASKLALSSISSEELWTKSGRLEKAGSELFHFSDRKNTKYLLSPTHEEEITTLVSSLVLSYEQLPVRLYQTSRKYRDELRPRHGLLRAREFIMKDLYTFDYNSSRALETYHEVREIYTRLFDELKLHYLVAEADSGDIGGDLSHEFHFPTSKGEDNVISCSACKYVANEELAESPVSKRIKPSQETSDFKLLDLRTRRQVPQNRPGLINIIYSRKNILTEDATTIMDIRTWRGISRDRRTLIVVWYKSPSSWEDPPTDGSEVNTHAIRAILPDIDASIEDPMKLWKRYLLPSESEDPTLPPPQRLVNLIDCRLPSEVQEFIKASNEQGLCRFQILPPDLLPDTEGPSKDIPVELEEPLKKIPMEFFQVNPTTQQPLNLLRIQEGDPCPRCTDGSLKVQKAIELGHTFHLGTRYSKPLEATIVAPVEKPISADEFAKDEDNHTNPSKGRKQTARQVPMQMGCHGIGVSRIIGAVADTLADDKGLNWPRAMAPFEVLIVPSNTRNDSSALEVYDTLALGSSLDLVLDDRDKSMGLKMGDADLIGYPVIVIVGRAWLAEGKLEVQCRRLDVKEKVPIGELKVYVESLLAQL